MTQGIVSYRSIPRILNVLDIPERSWTPHFTSVIHWVLRLGLGLLQRVQPMKQEWLAIIDHSIDIGTKKALVVLRVPINIVSRKKAALALQDCECIGLHIAEVVNGDSIAAELAVIFQQSGLPAGIVKDCDRTLNKGVCLWQQQHDLNIPIIDDISHVVAAAVKQQFENTDDYRRFTTLVSKAGKSLRQTQYAFLSPPKLRTKGRFLSIGKLGHWSEKMQQVLSQKAQTPIVDKLRTALPEFDDIKPFIQQFTHTASTVSEVLKILKNKGLNRRSFGTSRRLLNNLPNHDTVKHTLLEWLKKHMAIKKQLTRFPLLISSDIIESLFGRFKHKLEHNPQADMNRSVLMIPVLCGQLDGKRITQILRETKHRTLRDWEATHIPYTMAKKRREFFA